MAPGDWTFLSNYGHVLVALARNPTARMRDIAQQVGITERAVQQIVGELVTQGYVIKEKSGRRNHYHLAPGTHLRHDLERGVRVADFVAMVSGAEGLVHVHGVWAWSAPRGQVLSPRATVEAIATVLRRHRISTVAGDQHAFAPLAELFRDEVDVILAPTTPLVAPAIGQQTMILGGEEMAVRPNIGIYTQPISFVGLPVAAVPLFGLGALPIGVQAIAAPWREDLALRVARELERSGVASAPMP